MSNVAERGPASLARASRSIAARIFTLVVLSVTAAAAILFAITFQGPPPRMAPLAIEDLAEALHGRPLQRRTIRSGPGAERFGQDREPSSDVLGYSVRSAAPDPRSDEHADPTRAHALARTLGVPANDVVAFTSEQPPGMGLNTVNGLTVGWRASNGWHIVQTAPPPVFSRWHLVTLAAMLATLVLLSAIAWLIARAISRPIAQLAAAADRAQGGAPLPAVAANGPAEVMVLARAIASMHARLLRHAEQRTAMLGAIAHDLGTPLARLAFRVEELPDAARDRAAADLDEMRAMIADTLAFARDDVGGHDHSRIDLGSLLDSLAEDMRVGAVEITLLSGPRVVVRGDPHSLRRLFANLVGNAIRYGERALLSWGVADGHVTVVVDDDGPGIDPAQVDRLFEPFVRGDPSRNRATGGTGLGLAIVRSVAGRHGGTATLENRATGGARASVVLPISD